VKVTSVAKAFPIVTPAVFVTVITLLAAPAVRVVTVNAASPDILIAVAPFATNVFNVESVVEDLTFNVVTSASAVTAPVDVAPLRFKANVVTAGVVAILLFVVLTVTNVPSKFNVDKALESTVAAPAFFNVTVEIVFAFAVPALTSAIVTVPAV
jgi:hypothetical protein